MVISGHYVDNLKFTNCDLQGAHFKNITFNVPISFKGNKVQGLTLENCQFFTAFQTLKPMDLSGGIIFKGFYNTGSKIKGINFGHAKFEGAVFESCNVGRCNFDYANLENANFEGAVFESTSFAHTNLRYANLSYSGMNDVFGVSFANSDLSNADLSSTNLGTADFKNANLKDANLKGANFAFATGMTQAQIDHAIGDSSTILPEGIHKPATWH